jgi:choline kinase
MRGVILAAGRGSRLGHLSDERPKCLVRLAGAPLLDWQRGALAAAGVDELAVVAGYRSEQLADGPWTTMLAARWADTTMVASLCAASDWLHAAPCVVAYGDIVFDAETVERLIAAPGDIAIAYDPDWLDLWAMRFEEPLDDAERFRLAGGWVRQIGGRASAVTDIEGQYMGLLRFAPAGWEAAEARLRSLPRERRRQLDMTGLLQLLIDTGQHVAAVPAVHGWCEVDSDSDLMIYESLIEMGELAASST